MDDYFVVALHVNDVQFKQYGGTCYTSRATIDFQLQMVDSRLISRNRNVNCASRSFDLTLLDYFLWCAVMADNVNAMYIKGERNVITFKITTNYRTKRYFFDLNGLY